MKSIFVVSKPRGIPIKTKFCKSWNEISIEVFDIAKKLPKVKSGPKVKKIVNSPSPFLEENFNGSAV